MKQSLTKENLTEDWLILSSDRRLLANKSRKTHLGFLILLKFFQLNGRFPESAREIPILAIQSVACQINATLEDWRTYSWSGVTIKRHRGKIRSWCGYRESTRSDQDEFKRWLITEIIPQEHREDRLREALLERCRNLKIEPSANEQIRRLIQSALFEHDNRFCERVGGSFDGAMIERINLLLQLQPSDEGEWTLWQTLKNEPSKAGIESVKEAVARLQAVRKIELPENLFKAVSPKLLERYAKRAAVEEPFELRRHATSLRATLMAAFLYRRRQELTDHLVDLLVETVHKMGKKAERTMDEGLSEALKKALAKWQSSIELRKLR